MTSNGLNMDSWLEESFSVHVPTQGEIRQGWIVSRNNNEMLVDIGAKSEGIINSRELDDIDDKTREQLVVGEKIYVYVVDPEDSNGNIILSYKKAAERQDWIDANEYAESKKVHEGKIVGFNRGGLLVGFGQLRGFVPNSQLSREHQQKLRGENSQRFLQKLTGETIYVKILEVDSERNRLIFSEREAEKETREARRQKLLESMTEGSTFKGRVVNLTNYGAFIDIGAMEGLVHLSELSWKRITNPADFLSVGDEVDVVVISIDHEKQRIALSMKQLEQDPWDSIEELYKEGQLVEATITKLERFGAFARLNDDFELQGLIHISELSEKRVTHPKEVIRPKDIVPVRIIRIDAEQRQLGLSIKQVSSAEFITADLASLEEM